MNHEPTHKPFGLNALRVFIRLLLRLLTRFDVAGQENLPERGPAVLTVNHVSWADVPIIGGLSQGTVASFSAEKWENSLVLGWALKHFGSAIFVQRGEIDRKALRQASQWLQGGGILGVAPEGTRSYDGVLRQARDGVTWLVSRTGAEIVPIAIWGHEHLIEDWKHLRRPHVHVRIGQPYRLPLEAGKARSRDLEPFTEIIMRRIAALLPPERRGYYA